MERLNKGDIHSYFFWFLHFICCLCFKNVMNTNATDNSGSFSGTLKNVGLQSQKNVGLQSYKKFRIAISQKRLVFLPIISDRVGRTGGTSSSFIFFGDPSPSPPPALTFIVRSEIFPDSVLWFSSTGYFNS